MAPHYLKKAFEDGEWRVRTSRVCGEWVQGGKMLKESPCNYTQTQTLIHTHLHTASHLLTFIFMQGSWKESSFKIQLRLILRIMDASLLGIYLIP